MKPYTVVLLRGPKFSRELNDIDTFGTDAYVAHVSAESGVDAIAPAIKELLKADRRDCRQICDELGVKLTESDYIPLLVLKGHTIAVHWNWTLPHNLRNIPSL